MKPSVAALIAAAGSGTRFGGVLPKVYAELCGRPMLAWSLRAFDAVPDVTRILIAVAPEHLDRATDICHQEHLRTQWTVIPGEAQRQDTVRVGLQALEDQPPDIVCIHDGARPLVTPEIITDSIRLCYLHGASVACVPVTDTVKRFDEKDRVLETLDREQLRAIQTPQTFAYPLILAAHRHAQKQAIQATDDAALVEALRETVYAAPGSKENLKVTEADDLAHAEWLMRRRLWPSADAPMRAGHGYDLHRLVEGRPLILCGVQIEHDRGLLGHSDADAALHAVADAVLGAAGLEDIGAHFPDSNPDFLGADSARLLAQVVEMVADAGWSVGNADLTIIAEAPRLGPYRKRMVQALADALSVDDSRVSVKATTNEGLGPVGEGAAIACHAVVTLLATQPS